MPMLEKATRARVPILGGRTAANDKGLLPIRRYPVTPVYLDSRKGQEDCWGECWEA